MEIQITGTPKEIAALVLAVQKRQEPKNEFIQRLNEATRDSERVYPPRVTNGSIKAEDLSSEVLSEITQSVI